MKVGKIAMECLSCGDCCLRMSSLFAPAPCPKLVVKGNVYFCSDYKNRPEECVKHTFPSRFCPIGLEKLKLDTPDKVSRRIDYCWNLICRKIDKTRNSQMKRREEKWKN